MSSLCTNGQHAPIINLDIPHHYVKSSTPGHGHLFINKEMSWGEYKKLLKALLEAGIIGQGYYDMAIARQMSQVRMPDVLKASSPRPKAKAAQRTDGWGSSY